MGPHEFTSNGFLLKEEIQLCCALLPLLNVPTREGKKDLRYRDERERSIALYSRHLLYINILGNIGNYIEQFI